MTCSYVIEWDPSFELQTTVILVSEFGLFGVLVDPLILQVRETATNFRAIFQNEPTRRDVEVTVTGSFDVQPGTTLTAMEIPVASGPQFLIPQIADHINASGDVACNDRVYDFSDLDPAAFVSLPIVIKP